MQTKLAELRKLKEADEIAKLAKENEKLKKLVAEKKAALVAAETANGKVQVALPGEPGYVAPGAAPARAAPAPAPAAAPAAAAAPAPAAGKGGAPTGAPPGASTEKKKKPKKAAAPKKDEPVAVLDVTRLSLKVACIKTAVLHPDADGLYLEDAETGEEENRVVISGLVGKIPIEEMQNRMVILCMNMKPVKMRGIASTAMVMCANDPEKGVEIIDPPAGSVPGDIVTIAGWSAEDKLPDKQLNPKKKVLEAILPDLFTNDTGVATYKGGEWEVAGKGKCTCKTLFNAKIK